MPRDALPFRTGLARRLHCAEGHLRGITAMVERGADCSSLLHQILAVQAALREVNCLLLKHHLAVCLRERLLGPDIGDREKCLPEILALYNMIGAAASPDRKERA